MSRRRQGKDADKFNKRYSPEQKLAALRAVEGGQRVGEVCETVGISPETFRNWKLRYLRDGEAGLVDRAPSPTNKLSPEDEERILAEKAKNPLMGVHQLGLHLKRHCGLDVSPSVIARVFEDRGVVKLARTNGKPYEALDAFERPEPNDLWQLDWHQFRMTSFGTFFILGILDDRSRYCLDLVLTREKTATVAIDALRRCFERFGRPREALTDRGAEFVGPWNASEESEFRVFLRSQGVLHVLATSHRPTTLGKQERFWQTLESELIRLSWFRDEIDARERLEQWRQHYNRSRPHLALDGATPAETYETHAGASADEPPRPSGIQLTGLIHGQRIRLFWVEEEKALRIDLNDRRVV